MPKPDSYNGIRKITTEGLTLPNGKFIGFMNQGRTAQSVTINGDLLYNGLTRTSGGITFDVAADGYIPAECTHIKPASFDIIGFF